MFKSLNLVENLKTEFKDNKISIENRNNHKINIVINDIKLTNVIFSSLGEKGFKIIFKNDDFLIITSNNFYFKTRNFSLFKVQNLPEIVSFLDVITSVEEYIKNPEPNNNIDNTVALYLLNKTLIENAEYYNFDVTDYKNAVRKAALSINSIGDITIYD